MSTYSGITIILYRTPLHPKSRLNDVYRSRIPLQTLTLTVSQFFATSDGIERVAKTPSTLGCTGLRSRGSFESRGKLSFYICHYAFTFNLFEDIFCCQLIDVEASFVVSLVEYWCTSANCSRNLSAGVFIAHPLLTLAGAFSEIATYDSIKGVAHRLDCFSAKERSKRNFCRTTAKEQRLIIFSAVCL